MKKIGLIILFLCIAMVGFSQEYTTGIGARIGTSTGLTVKHFFAQDRAVDVIIASRWHGFNITGLYEIHKGFKDAENLYLYFGGGAHIGFWDGDRNPWFDDNDNYVVIGIDGVLGLEYTLVDAPICFALDWKPGFNIIGYTGFWGDEVALSARFVFK